MGSSSGCCSGAEDSAQTVNMDSGSPRPDYPAISGVGEDVPADPIASLPKKIICGTDLKTLFQGAWEDSRNSSTKNVYVVQEEALVLLNTKVSDLKYSGGKMHIVGTTLSAGLDESQAKLQWSDGDTWSRAGLDGSWRKAGFDGLLSISGELLTTLTPNGEKMTNPLAVIDPKTVVILISNATITGTMDSSSMTVNWTDGDQWTRQFLAEIVEPPA